MLAVNIMLLYYYKKYIIEFFARLAVKVKRVIICSCAKNICIIKYFDINFCTCASHIYTCIGAHYFQFCGTFG